MILCQVALNHTEHVYEKVPFILLLLPCLVGVGLLISVSKVLSSLGLVVFFPLVSLSVYNIVSTM